jgi:hypothetical protein
VLSQSTGHMPSPDIRPEPPGVPFASVPLNQSQVQHKEEKNPKYFSKARKCPPTCVQRGPGAAPGAQTLVLLGKLQIKKLQAGSRLLPDWSGSHDASSYFSFSFFFFFFNSKEKKRFALLPSPPLQPFPWPQTAPGRGPSSPRSGGLGLAGLGARGTAPWAVRVHLAAALRPVPGRGPAEAAPRSHASGMRAPRAARLGDSPRPPARSPRPADLARWPGRETGSPGAAPSRPPVSHSPARSAEGSSSQ